MATSKSTIEELKFTSNILQEDIEAMVYLPPNYSPLYTYPLVIAQDGQDYFNLGRIARLADQLISEGSARDIVIVGVPYKNREERWHRYHPDGKKHEAYIRFMTRELLSEMKKRYAIDDLAGGRFLIGDSLGATVSLELALRFPFTFGNVILQSPYVDDGHIKKVQNFKHASQLAVYHSIGEQETAVETTWGKHADFLVPNHKLHNAIMDKPFAKYVYDENDGNHTWTYWQGDLEKALRTMLPLK